MPIEFSGPVKVSFFSNEDGSFIGNMEAVPEFEPETSLPEKKESDIRAIDIYKEITFTCSVSPRSLKNLRKVTYGWKCSGPVRKRLWNKLFSIKCRNYIRKEMINRVNQRSTF